MKTEIKMKWQPFHHYAAKQGLSKKELSVVEEKRKVI